NSAPSGFRNLRLDPSLLFQQNLQFGDRVEVARPAGDAAHDQEFNASVGERAKKNVEFRHRAARLARANSSKASCIRSKERSRCSTVRFSVSLRSVRSMSFLYASITGSGGRSGSLSRGSIRSVYRRVSLNSMPPA